MRKKRETKRQRHIVSMRFREIDIEIEGNKDEEGLIEEKREKYSHSEI